MNVKHTKDMYNDDDKDGPKRWAIPGTQEIGKGIVYISLLLSFIWFMITMIWL